MCLIIPTTQEIFNFLLCNLIRREINIRYVEDMHGILLKNIFKKNLNLKNEHSNTFSVCTYNDKTDYDK